MSDRLNAKFYKIGITGEVIAEGRLTLVALDFDHLGPMIDHQHGEIWTGEEAREIQLTNSRQFHAGPLHCCLGLEHGVCVTLHSFHKIISLIGRSLRFRHKNALSRRLPFGGEGSAEGSGDGSRFSLRTVQERGNPLPAGLLSQHETESGACTVATFLTGNRVPVRMQSISS